MSTKMQSLTFLWLLSILSLLRLQAARGSPLTSASSGTSSARSGAATESTAPVVSRSANVLTNFTSQSFLSINGSTNSTHTSGLVTMFKTLELIPQPVPNDSLEGASPPISSQKAEWPTTSPSVQPRSSVEPSISSSPQVPMPQPIDQSVNNPKLQPIIVGGITYAPVHAHHTHSNVIPWQETPRHSQTLSKDVEFHEYDEKHFWGSHGLNRETLESGEAQGGLPPVVVGDLTYRPIGQDIKPGLPSLASVNVAGSARETATQPTNTLLEANTMSSTLQPGSTATIHPYPANNGFSSPISTYHQIPTSLLASSTLVLSSQVWTALPGNNDLNHSSSILLRESPTITVNSAAYSLNPPPFTIAGQSIIPASPSTFIIANQTFTAYPSGLAISGTEVFQGSTAITLSGTTISLGPSDIVVGTSTIPFASVTGLGEALSSGLSAAASASGSGTGPTPTSTSAKNSQHESAAGQLRTRVGSIAMGWCVVIVLTLTMVT